MRAGIPELSALIRPLAELVEKVGSIFGKGTRLAAGLVTLFVIVQIMYHNNACHQCKCTIVNQVTLAHFDPYKRLCAYTDAPNFLCFSVVTQIPIADAKLLCAEHSHKSLAFLSEHFTDSTFT